MFVAVVTPVAPYDWPMNTDAQFDAKTSDAYVDQVPPDILIPSMWSSQPCSFDIQIQGSPSTVIVTAVALTTAPDGDSLVFTQQNATTIRVTGSTPSLDGEYFNFKLRDNTVAQLPPVNDEDWIAVTKWNTPPRPWHTILSYTFSVTYEGTVDNLPVSGQDPYTITQYVYWSWEQGLQTISTLVQQGEV